MDYKDKGIIKILSTQDTNFNVGFQMAKIAFFEPFGERPID